MFAMYDLAAIYGDASGSDLRTFKPFGGIAVAAIGVIAALGFAAAATAQGRPKPIVRAVPSGLWSRPWSASSWATTSAWTRSGPSWAQLRPIRRVWLSRGLELPWEPVHSLGGGAASMVTTASLVGSLILVVMR